MIKPENILGLVDYTSKDILLEAMNDYEEQGTKTKIIKTCDGNWALFKVEK